MKKSVRFYTLGCKTNQYETQAIRESLFLSGAFIEAHPAKKPDIYIINTCTVTAKADRDSRWIIRHCYRENPGAKILVTGCLTEMDEGMIRGLPGVSFIIKNKRKDKIRYILTDNEEETTDVQLYNPLKISDFEGRTRAYIKIQDGCNNLCSYCKIPLVRGRSRSRGLDDILEEIDRLLDKGFKELVLTGICLGDWGKDLKEDLRLAHLIDMIDKKNRDFRVRLSSIEPNMISTRLIESIAKSKKICRHLHIPLQSGSDRILKLMNRPYRARYFMNLIKDIKRLIPQISITSDVMVGFPSETKGDFRQTQSLIRHIMPSRLHIFSYSHRQGTMASRYKSDLTFNEIKHRRIILKEIEKESSYKYRKRFLNRMVQGLIETERDRKTNLLTGYTDTYIRFLLNGPDSLMGRLLPLKVQNTELKSIFCEYLHGIL